MSALNDFAVAAGSYFGMPEGRVMQGSTVDVSNGDMELVLRIVLTTDDVVGIGKRMGVMMVEAQVDAQQAAQQAAQAAARMPPREALRTQWNSLPASQRSAFGSFHKYVQAHEQAGAEWPLGTQGAMEGEQAAGFEPPAGWAGEPKDLELPAQQLSMAGSIAYLPSASMPTASWRWTRRT